MELNAAEICEHAHQSFVYHSVWHNMTLKVEIQKTDQASLDMVDKMKYARNNGIAGHTKCKHSVLVPK